MTTDDILPVNVDIYDWFELISLLIQLKYASGIFSQTDHPTDRLIFLLIAGSVFEIKTIPSPIGNKMQI